jgi:CBS domain-containing protein
MLSVNQLMTTDLVTVSETDDLALAESLLREKGVRHLPVVREGKLVGLLTRRDLRGLGAGSDGAVRGAPVSSAMVRELVTVGPESSLAHAARLMLERKFGCLPVCTGEGTLVGIVTESDFVRFAADVLRDLDRVADAVQRSSIPAGQA